ncbi:GIY-YIG nuclease family protein [Aspergillus affinis]|uniref:GIY-YIG nuclease family protein n=1 Tax=Aspergillus affinis TaxID=1070780 RepID=UPI0022FED825|nr:uncharacterized protein KD926_007708 [Aspergillus affinis]KAI9040765.1 hypothetical protein KD926_007708 [Aspergillus affinis]
MAQTCSSGTSTTLRGLVDDAPKRPLTPQAIEIEDDASDKSTDDTPSDEPRNHSPPIQINSRTIEIVDLVETSPFLSDRNQMDCQETDANTDTVRYVHQEMEIDQEELLVVEHHSHAQDHSRQIYNEETTEIPTRVQENKSASSRKSSTNPETPRRSPVATKNSPSPMLNSTWETVTSMSERIKRGLSADEKKNVGHAYLLEDHREKTGRFKIGSSQTARIRQRVANQVRDCNLEGWTAKSFPQFPLREYVRLEKIAQKELYFMNERFRCDSCKTDHTEYFRGEKEIARETLEFWAQWLERCKPYDSDGELLPFWVRRLDMLKDKNYYDNYFQCLDSNCERDPGLEACRGCLRAGWKAWTEAEIESEDPELEDPELEEATRKAPEQALPMSLPLFNFICILAVISFIMECIPVIGNIVHPNGIRKIQSLLILCLWVYKEMTGPTPEASAAKSNQEPSEGLAKTPRKQSTVTVTVRTAPAKLLNASRHVELPGNTPVRMSARGQIPDTEPIMKTYNRGSRESATDESPSKAALARKQNNRLDRRSIEQALERTFTLPSTPA